MSGPTASRTTRAVAGALILMLLGGLLAFGVAPASAAQINVTTTTDGGPGSLRAAISTANGNGQADIIVLQADATYLLDLCAPGTDDNNGTGDLDLSASHEVTIEGNGATLRQTCANERVLHAWSSPSDTVLRELTLTGGRQVAASGGGGGLASSGDVELEGVVIRNNTTNGIGGGLYVSGLLQMFRSTVRSNRAEGEATLGGGIYAGDLVSIERSTVSSNSVLTTDTSNGASTGGGVYLAEGGFVIASTIANNTAEGAISAGGGVGGDTPLNIDHATIAGNTAATAANVEASVLTATRSVIADPHGGGADCILSATPQSTGFNFSGDSTCGFTTGTDEQGGGNPQLGPLTADNGGGTATRVALVGSPLRDAIPLASCAVQHDTDQRGVARPQGAGCDIGATESPLPFSDVPGTHTFFSEITSLAGDDIIRGYPDGTFRPADSIRRQAMAAFLYRLAGEPAVVVPPEPSFSDVPADHPFSTEIEWASAEGIARGYPDGGFRPGAPVTRQAMASFLYQFLGAPLGPFQDPGFTDVPPGHQFQTAIWFLAAEGISTGYGDGTFRPGDQVTRQAVAAFLFRLGPS